MSKIVWDAIGEHFFETGVSQGVLYPYDSNNKKYGPGVPWNGLTAVTETPSGAEANPMYADDIKYLNLYSAEEFGATIEAYTYPDEFMECDGSESIADGVVFGQQGRKTFGFAFRSALGNDVDGSDYGYKLHLIYGCKASPSERAYASINDSPEGITFSWEITTTPIKLDGHKPVSCITIDSKKVDETKLAKLEDKLYGVNAADFDASKTYSVGDYCVHSSKTYICTTAVEIPGEWNEDNWEEFEGRFLPTPEEIIEMFE